MSHDIIVLIAGCLLWAFGLLCGTLLERNRNTKGGTPSASHNSAMADIARAFDDGFTAGGMGIVSKDIAWREWQRRQ